MDEWVRAGVSHACVAPGSRSTPMAIQLALRPEISLEVFHDERSAAFAALGIGVSTGRPAIVLCTSGTAATHFHAAVVESDLSAVPLIVLTADRPPELRDVGAPQTIRQTQLYGSAVRWFYDPGVPSSDVAYTWRGLASRIVAETMGNAPGPVHVNLPFREPLVGTAKDLPESREGAWSEVSVGRSVDESAIQKGTQLAGRRGVIIAGKGATESVVTLARSLQWPIFADARSGLRKNNFDDVVVSHFDGVLRANEFVSRHQPEIVVRIGEPPASKVLSQWVSAIDAHLWQVSPFPIVVDPDYSVSQHIVGDVDTWCSAVAARVATTEPSWLTSWTTAQSAAQNAIQIWCDAHWSEPTAVRIVSQVIADSCSQLVVSSSMPIRDLEWFGGNTEDSSVESNRGANGIDGVVSTAVGVSVATQQPTVLLIGDVAMLHDVNGLIGLTERNSDLRIVVMNNNGGSIFSFLPQAQVLSQEVFEKLYGTPHDVHFESLAHAYGLSFVRVTNGEALKTALGAKGPVIIEVCTDRSVNVSQHDSLHQQIISAVHTSL